MDVTLRIDRRVLQEIAALATLVAAFVIASQDKWVFANDDVAPVIELSRSLHGSDSSGRLYWGKSFSAMKPLGYEVAGFDSLVYLAPAQANPAE